MFSDYTKTMLENVDITWLIIITKNMDIIVQILKRINKDLKTIDNTVEYCISPHPNNIFRAFTYFPIDKLKIVLIGQDPYSEYKKANGLCFSYSDDYDSNCNDSTKSIIRCIKNTCNIDISCNDIETWANNNMLMLNTYLTKYSKLSVKNGLVKESNFWKPFMINLLNDISCYDHYENDEIYFLLWGSTSQQLEQYINNPKFKILKWGHPSPLLPNNINNDNIKNFIHCDHFKILRDNCDFDLKNTQISIKKEQLLGKQLYIFTDGGCNNNGKRNSTASYAYFIPKIFNNNNNYHNEIKFSDTVKRNIYKYNSKTNRLETLITIKPVSNLRAELLAVISSLIFIIDNNIHKSTLKIIIISDCEYVINQFTGKHNASANLDLINIMKTIKKIIDKPMEMKHQYSHTNLSNKKKKMQKKTTNINSNYNKELVKNNIIVDKMCTIELSK